jgi:hypothetical protein
MNHLKMNNRLIVRRPGYKKPPVNKTKQNRRKERGLVIPK